MTATHVELVEKARSGRDIAAPTWLRSGPADRGVRFDSAVIYGAGIGALTCAARLSRSDEFGGRVTISGNAPKPDPRLINGCTLRARSLEYYGAALGIAPREILERLYGDRVGEAVTYRQEFVMFRESGEAAYPMTKNAPFMKARPDKRPMAYGLRNGHLAGTLASLLPDGVEWETPAADIASLRALAKGERPIVVNGNAKPPEGSPDAIGPRRFVAAYQCKLRQESDSFPGPNASMVVGVPAQHGIDVGVFYPFVDPLTPEANCYGIMYRIVDPSREYSKEDEIAQMRAHIHGIAKTIGWTPVDEEATGAGALVPAYPWTDVDAGMDDYVNLHRIFSAGYPIITGCGMARAGLAGWVCAEAILAGENPSRAMNRGLRKWRGLNQRFALLMDGHPSISSTLLHRIPRLILPLANVENAWVPVGDWN